MSRLFVLYLLSLTVRSLLIGAIAALILRRSHEVHVRHAVWTLLLFVVFLMPIADAVLPAAMVPAAMPEVFVPIQTFIVSAPPAQVDPNLLSMDHDQRRNESLFGNRGMEREELRTVSEFLGRKRICVLGHRR